MSTNNNSGSGSGQNSVPPRQEGENPLDPPPEDNARDGFIPAAPLPPSTIVMFRHNPQEDAASVVTHASILPSAPPLGAINVPLRPHGARGFPTLPFSSIGGGSVGTVGSIDSVGQKFRKLFNGSSDAAPEAMQLEEGLVLGKHERGIKGTKDYKINMEMATRGIEPKLGVAKPFNSSLDGEVEEGDQTKDQWIQDAYVMNLSKLDDLEARIIQYDMMDLFMVAKLRTGMDLTKIEHVADLWSEERTNLLQTWDKVSWENACYWQLAINRRCDGANKESHSWAAQLLRNSCTSDLRDLVNTKYKSLSPEFKGAITYTWLICFNLFSKSRDTTAALKRYLKLFETKGLQRIRGENVVVAKKEVIAVCKRLDCTGDLPDETTIDVLRGLQRVTVVEFKDVFHSYHQEAMKSALEVSGSRPWGHNSTLEEVIYLMSLALDYYINLNVSGRWTIPKGHKFAAACWNCDDEHCNVRICTKPKDEKKIAANRKKFLDAKNRRQQDDTPKGTGKPGDGNYSRNKWGAPKVGEPTVRWFQGQPQAYCSRKCDGKLCGWNNNHTTKFHAVATRSANWTVGDLAKLSPKHPLVNALGTGGSLPSPPPQTANALPPDQSPHMLAQVRTLANQFDKSVKGDEARTILESFLNIVGKS
jgi:hypothetical protein